MTTDIKVKTKKIKPPDKNKAMNAIKKRTKIVAGLKKRKLVPQAAS